VNAGVGAPGIEQHHYDFAWRWTLAALNIDRINNSAKG
jgi:hypothetical protein